MYAAGNSCKTRSQAKSHKAPDRKYPFLEYWHISQPSDGRGLRRQNLSQCGLRPVPLGLVLVRLGRRQTEKAYTRVRPRYG